MTSRVESRQSYWIRVFAIHQIKTFSDMKTRMLSTFENMSQEAEDAAQRRWDELIGAFSDGSDDPADAAEEAEEVGIALYQSLAEMKQVMLNLAAAGLYHLFEQQAIALV